MSQSKGVAAHMTHPPTITATRKSSISSKYDFGDKLYIVTRRDIAPGYQAVQSCHAIQQFMMEHEQISKRWFVFSNHLALLSVTDETELLDIVAQAIDDNITVSVFREPDVGGAVTAIALEPGEKTIALCSNLPLALAGVKQ